ncbi:MAG: NAD(P)-dependent oxidoreductase [Microthrixaceae bacterium]|nr:NAD(P)-dependent oxidoreductase [Microthrixaceae bacterium]
MTEHRPSSVFITGANGFVGRALAERFRAEGVEVRGVDVSADPDHGVVAGDIADPSTWSHALAGAEVAIHTAAIVSNNIATERAWHINVVGTQRVLDAAAHAGVGRFVQISTMGVTRFAHAHPDAARRFLPDRELDERWPLMPTGNPYTDTKITAEHLVLAAHAAGEQSCCVIRPADIYGPGCRPWVLEPIAALRSGRFLLPARGKGLFTPIYIDDLVDGIVTTATHPAATGQIFNLGGESPVTTLEYFGHFTRMLGMDDPPRSAPTSVAVAAAEAARLVAVARRRHTELGRGVMLMLAKTRGVSNEKAHRVLGWWPKVDLDEGMRRVEAWLRSEGHLG